jgi:zinc-ribbon domain
MFCPKCGAENQDQTRFCRGCGTDLEAVALALNAQLIRPVEMRPTEESKMEMAQQRQQLQVDGIHRVVRGALIFATGCLLAVPLALFGKNTDWHSNWILIWLFMCGWLPVWGAITAGTGLSNLIHSRMMQRSINSLGFARTTVSTHGSGQTQRIGEAEYADEVPAPVSASERTTASLE